MNISDINPIDFYNNWLKTPIVLDDNFNVIDVMNALNKHPISVDETAQDYFMPSRRYREMDGKFRIFGENQDTWYCFIYDGKEIETNPAVYFETCLDLKIDHNFDDKEIIDGDHVMVCQRFRNFLWHMLGQHICIRMEGNGLYQNGVSGMVFDDDVELDKSFLNPLGIEFPAGYTCCISQEVICVSDWGAAFLNKSARSKFINDYKPIIKLEWSRVVNKLHQ